MAVRMQPLEVMMEIVIDGGLLHAARRSEPEIKLELATLLYQRERLTLGQAADRRVGAQHRTGHAPVTGSACRADQRLHQLCGQPAALPLIGHGHGELARAAIGGWRIARHARPGLRRNMLAGIRAARIKAV